MKKYFILPAILVICLFISLPYNAQACALCEVENELVYHWYCSALSGYGKHFANAFLYKPETVTAPVYEIYATVGNKPYIILLSENEFQAITENKNGNTIDCSWAGGSGAYKTSRFFIHYLGVGNQPMESWEYTAQSRGKPVNEVTLNSINASDILAIDTSSMIPLINSDGSLIQPEEFDPFSTEYDEDVPVPQIITKYNVIAGITTPIISFTNGSSDYNISVYARWNSINDITLRRELLHWVYDYAAIIQGDLQCWVSDEDNHKSNQNFDFFNDSDFWSTYTAFLNKFPLADRYITNDPTLFEKLTGYKAALFDFTDNYMNLPNNAYSKPEFFIRYYYKDDNQQIHYGRWAHITFPLIPSGQNGFTTTIDQLWKGNLDYQVSNKPLTTEEVLDSNTYFDQDQTKYNIINNQQSLDYDEINWNMSIENLQSMTSIFGQMPAFVATVFSCYPSWMVQLIGATITILCALAIYHGIRG